MLKQYKLKDYKFRLVIWVTALSILGVMVVGSAQEDLMSKQILGLILGLVCMVIISLIDYTWIMNFYWIAYIGGVILMALLPVLGREVNGAQRWIVIGGLQFQPSDHYSGFDTAGNSMVSDLPPAKSFNEYSCYFNFFYNDVRCGVEL